VVCRTNDTLRTRLVKFKSKSEKVDKEVVYSIPCRCGKCYIGETGRTLETRLKEHKQSLTVRRCDVTTSKLVEHAFAEDHIFEWDNAKVMTSEKEWKARKFHEATHIYMGGDEVICAPSMDIDPAWKPILDDYKKAKKINFENISSTGLRRSVRVQANNRQ
jgi:predicted GIY-YIG superfamily endonuclease